jgi:hypothetical protein
MTTVLLCGLCPLPFENTRQNYGPGIRTWQFARGLMAGGARVRLLAMKIPGVYRTGEAVDREVVEGVAIERWSDTRFLDPTAMKRALAELRPDAVVGATVYGSFALAQAEPEVPFWADQFGHVMAEAQAKAALDGANWPLAHFWRMVQPVLQRVDRLSVVSERQRWAAVGELGAAGRLTAETCGYEFVHIVPCALVPVPEWSGPPLLRGGAVPEEAFLLLWSGGFNVWSDVETLFAGVEGAMVAEPRVHFAATGGAIAGHDEQTYRRFEERVAASRFRSRFHLQGWVPGSQVPAYLQEADLGVLTERPIYEGMLGSKNRVVQWMGAGLPVAYNRVGDLGDLLAEEGLGLTFEAGDAAALTERIRWAAGHPEELREMARRARAHALGRLTYEASTEALAEWAARPDFAPDACCRAGVENPADHGGMRERLAEQARKLAPVRRSTRLRALWRRLWSTG